MQSNKFTEDSNGVHNIDLETQHLVVTQDPGLTHADPASLPLSLNPSVPTFQNVSHQFSVIHHHLTHHAAMVPRSDGGTQTSFIAGAVRGKNSIWFAFQV